VIIVEQVFASNADKARMLHYHAKDWNGGMRNVQMNLKLPIGLLQIQKNVQIA
jgi:hypothetical protein